MGATKVCVRSPLSSLFFIASAPDQEKRSRCLLTLGGILLRTNETKSQVEGQVAKKLQDCFSSLENILVHKCYQTPEVLRARADLIVLAERTFNAVVSNLVESPKQNPF